VRDFASQAPQEMHWTSFKRGCVGAGEALFPKNAQALRSLSDNTLDDYTRSYRNQQASLEVMSHCAMFVAGALEISAFAKAGRAAEQVVSTERFFVTRGGARITDDWAKLSGMLKQAAKGKGNFGIGSATIEQANTMGKAWVNSGYRISSNGKAWISADGMKQYRPPSHKPFLNKRQANFERKFEGQISQRWQVNAHLDIIEYFE